MNYVAALLTAEAYTVDIPVGLAIVGAVFTLLVMIGAAWSVVRAAALRATLEVQSASIESLNKANVGLRQAILDQEKSFGHQLHESEKRVAVLEGRLQALTTDFAQMVVNAVIRTVREAQTLPFADPSPIAGGD